MLPPAANPETSQPQHRSQYGYFNVGPERMPVNEGPVSPESLNRIVEVDSSELARISELQSRATLAMLIGDRLGEIRDERGGFNTPGTTPPDGAIRALKNMEQE